MDTETHAIAAWNQRAAAVPINAALLIACQGLLAYRDRVGPRGFQLEKADDYLRLIRAAITQAEQVTR